MKQPLEKRVLDISSMLFQCDRKIVFAESCTGGLMSAVMATVPGISRVHCGSAVVYRLETKTEWLGVSASLLIDPGPVSEPVARAMVEGVLKCTPEADIAVAITGHLGPDAPDGQDGLIFVGTGVRGKSCRIAEHRLPDFKNESGRFQYPGESVREQRQWAAADFALSQLEATLRAIIPVY